MRNIILCGMIGSGYKKVAGVLNKFYHMRIVDTDEILMRNIGTDLFDIYSTFPLDVRNDLAERLAKQLSETENMMVIAGECVSSDRSALEILKKTCVVVYIRENLESILSDCIEPEHPLIRRDLQQLSLLYPKRDSVMEEYADIIVELGSDMTFLPEKISGVEKKVEEKSFDDSILTEQLKEKYLFQYSDKNGADDFAKKALAEINRLLEAER